MSEMTHVPERVSLLERELRDIFGPRLQALVVYGLKASPAPGSEHQRRTESARTRTMALVDTLMAHDLTRCAAQVARWHDGGLATPLLLTRDELGRSLDAFPLEFGAILADHIVIAGKNPFDGLAVDPTDVRRACEVQARSHLLHLREGFLETRGRTDALALLIVQSAAPFAALLASLARLQGSDAHDPAAAARHVERALQLPPGAATDVVKLAHVTEISSADASRIFPSYLDAAERLVKYVDGWSATS
jgi:hypothetical protein